MDAKAASAADSGRAQLDPTIAETDRNGAHPPAFATDGAISIYCPGFGYCGVSGIAPDEVAAEPTEAQLTARAKANVESMRKALRSPAPTAIVLSRGGYAIFNGQEALPALAEIDAALSGGQVNSSSNQTRGVASRALSDEARREIAEVVSHSKGVRP